MKNKVVTRFAPSPTGYLHVGGLRTALYSYLYARQQKGKFILRIEDTDRERFVEGAVEKLLATLYAVGMKYDGKPVVQSERLMLYKKYSDELIKLGKAYYSFKNKEDLDQIKERLMKENRPLKKFDLNENYSQQEIEHKISSGELFTIRLETPNEGKISYVDLVRNEVSFEYKNIDDFIIIKSDGYPTYHLANVIDDHLMEITHVIRGEEWLSSTPKHIILYESLGWKAPLYAHLPLLLNLDRSKLSKRQGDVAVEDYLAKGYLPEALLNFVALLGWNPGEGSTQEFFTVKDLIKQFDLKKINSSGAVFDIEKLNWLNAKYLREILKDKDFEKLTKGKIKTHLDSNSVGKEILKDKAKYKILSNLIRNRIHFLQEIDLFFQENTWLNDVLPKFDHNMIAWKKSTLEDAIIKLKELKLFFEALPTNHFKLPAIEKDIRYWITDKGYEIGNVLWPLRVTLTGQEKSPSPFEVASLLGQHEVIRRIDIVLDKSR